MSNTDFSAGVQAERDRILDLISARMCNHRSCRECDALESLAHEIDGLGVEPTA